MGSVTVAAGHFEDYVTHADRAWRKLEKEARVRLSARLKEHGASELIAPYMPMADNILVLRFPSPGASTKTKGGLYIPESAQVEPEPLSKGILVQAGCLARDVLRAHGILLGDEVQIGRFAGWEHEVVEEREGRASKKILQMKERDVLGSFDLYTRLFGEVPTMRIVYDGETEEHRIVPITEE